VDEIRWIGGVGKNAAYFGGSEIDKFGLFSGKKGVDGLGVAKVEFRTSTEKKTVIAEGTEVAGNGRPDKAAMAGDEDA